ncbi:MAG: hypothetical protein FWG38_05790 [Defluviitaleaceae bacterium]|nr:hypothetical protein [Defluviitaleaceae bacterium]
MPKHQALKDAIRDFSPGGEDTPVLYSTTEVNERGFKKLLGRNLKSRPISNAVWVFALIIMVGSVALTIMFGTAGTPAFGGFVPIFVIFFVFRTTVISAGDKGLELYFVEAKWNSRYMAYDKISLPYDRITSVKTKTGRFNAHFTFVFSDEGKNYKIKTSVPNRDKKMEEQAGNLKHLKNALQQKNLGGFTK